MSVEDNLRVYDAVTKALNEHDLDRFENFHLESVIQRDPTNAEPIKGRKAIRAGLEPFVKAFPDLRMSTDRVFGSGDWISVQGHFQGTHRAALEVPGAQTIPATNKSIRVPFAFIAKLEGGKFAETNVYYDQMAMMAQLGLLPQGPPQRRP
jgi:predicted ester cyclase